MNVLFGIVHNVQLQLDVIDELDLSQMKECCMII